MLTYLTYYNVEKKDMSTNNIEQFIDHEARIRFLERIAESIDKRFESMENKMNTQFYFLTGLIITSILAPVILHALKLI